MNHLPIEDISRFDPILDNFAFIQEKYGDNYPIVLYEPSIHCQEKKVLKNLLKGNSSIHSFSEFKEAFKFVKSLGISFILIVSSDFDERHVLRNFQTLGYVHGRTMFDFEEDTFFKDLFQGLTEEMIKSLKIKTFVFVNLPDSLIEGPVNKEGEEEVMVMCDLKNMANKFRQEFMIIWYDPHLDSEVKETFKQKFDIEERNIYDNFEKFYKRIHSAGDPPFHLILTGKNEAEKIVNEMDQLKNSLLGLYIYCKDSELSKIKNRNIFIKDSIEKLVPKITEGIRTKSKLTNSFPAFATNFDASDKTHINSLHYYLQGLINFENRRQARDDFLNLGKKIYESRKILQFEKEYQEYNQKEIFRWYTLESPVYKLVNNCLRIATSDSILYCRYVLKDLETAIREKYLEESHKFNGVVYRGSYITTEEWGKLQNNEGKEIEMYGFLSTSQNIEIAESFLCSDLKNKILITIIIPPLPASELNEQGFANISQDSGFQEAEILFNVRSKFRILEAGMTKISHQGKECRHLVLLYGARLLRESMTKTKPVISLELKLPPEVKCGICESAEELFAFQQKETEVRCLECLRNNIVPQNVPLLALDFENTTESKVVITKSFKGQLLTFNQATNLPYHGYRCSQCQEYEKKKYYKWINLNTEEGFEQCSDCFGDKKKMECHILIAETDPYTVWQEFQQEWETVDTDYQTKVSISMGEKKMNQSDVYLSVQRFDLCIEYESKLVKKMNRKRWREKQKLKCFERMGKANQEYANYQKALEIYSKFVDFWESLHNQKSLSAVYFSLASVNQDLGQNQEALKWSTKALNIMKSIHGDNHPETAIAYNNYALVCGVLGRYQEALESLGKSLDIRKAVFGDKHPEIAISFSNYAEAFLNFGQYQEALEYFEKALTITKAIFGDQHERTANVYYCFSKAFGDLKKYQESLEYGRKALDIRKTIFGKKHPLTSNSYHICGSMFAHLGRYQEALEYCKEGLDIQKTIFEEKHPSVAQSYSLLASIYCDLERYQEALEYAKKTLKTNKDILGVKHPWTATAYRHCAIVYSRFGHNIAMTALSLERYQEGPEDSKKVKMYSKKAKKFSRKARKFSKKAKNIFQGIYGEMHRKTAASYLGYAECCGRSGLYIKAVYYSKKATEINLTLFGAQDPNTISSYNYLNTALENLDRVKTL